MADREDDLEDLFPRHRNKAGTTGKMNSDFILKELNRISRKGDSPPSGTASTYGDNSSMSAAPAKYPWYIVFILGNELCERFAFYGMKAVLTLYFLEVFLWSEGTSTLVYHVFLVLSYFTPIFGAMLADGYIGKFATIFSLSLVYVGGLVLMTLASIPSIGLNPIAGFVSGLLLVAVGTGGIKPCVVSYGGDQFKEGQERHRERFFSVFYFCINAGSLVSTFVTPILRSDLPCLGKDGCYPAAFGLPAGLLTIAIALFVLGRPFYRDVPPSGNILGQVITSVSHAIYNKIRNRPPIGQSKPSHWLDYASDKYSKSLLQDIKQILPVLKMFLPLPIFWTLFDQKGSRWTLQANKMDGRVTDNFFWKPDQVQIFNPVLILILVPVFETIIFPLLEKFNIKFRLLARMVTGMFLAGIAFVIAGVIQMQLDSTLPVPPPANTAELRFFNTLPCQINATVVNGSMTMPNMTASLESFGMSEFQIDGFDSRSQKNHSVFSLSFVTDEPNKCGFLSMGDTVVWQHVNLTKRNVYSVYVSVFEGKLTTKVVLDKKEKPRKGAGFVRFVIPFRLNTTSSGGYLALINPDVPSGKNGSRYVLDLDRVVAFNQGVSVMEQFIVAEQGKYEVYLEDAADPTGYRHIGHQRLEIPNGGVYTILLKDDFNAHAPWVRHDIVAPSSLSVFWQLPQYFVITLAEVLFSVSGLAFAYSQSPASMKAVLQAGWLMTTAFGNVIVIIISGAQLVDDRATEFFVFAGLIGVFAMLFAIMTRYYTYVEQPGSNGSPTDIAITKEELEDSVNL